MRYLTTVQAVAVRLRSPGTYVKSSPLPLETLSSQIS